MLTLTIKNMNAIRNARIVTADEDFLGSLVVRGESILEVNRGTAGVVGDDWGGDFLIPGLVELHTDNLEKHLMPRPKVHWPILPAIIAHDAQIAAAGITTVLDAISVGDIDSDSLRNQTLSACTDGLTRAIASGVLRAEHYLHIRLELAEEHLLQMFSPFLQDERLRLVSVMDHTPGQRQWTDISHYRTYVGGKRGWSEEKIDSMLESLLARQEAHAANNRKAVIAACRQLAHPVPLAAHDDTTVAHVNESVGDGIAISEFPTTLAAAGAARAHGMGIIMGAPNMVRGGSHSGNISAVELARADLLDVLSSDYVPASLLHAAFLLEGEGFGLAKAIATVTRNPAHMIGLRDRGEIAAGLRADYLRVRVVDGVPIVVAALRAGQRIC